MRFRDASFRVADASGAAPFVSDSTQPIPERRRVLATLAVMPFATSLALPLANAASPASGAIVSAHDRYKRIVVLDWDLTEVMLSLGVVPVGVARPFWYMQLDGVPPLPNGVVDTGLLYQPNFEVLQRLAPDVIVITEWHAMIRPMLERIAPTLTVATFAPGVDVYTNMRKQTRYLAGALGREREAKALLTRLDDVLAGSARRLQVLGAGKRPVYVIRPIDARHVTVYGPHGLFGGVMRELGLINAWQGGADVQGAAGTDLAALAQQPEASAVLVSMPSPGVPEALASSPLWSALPFVKDGRLHQIGKISATGGPVTAMRFATQLASVFSGAAS